MRRWIVGAAMAGLLVPVGLHAQSASDRDGAELAAMEYLEGFYEGSTEKIKRAVHPDVLKFGFYREGSDGEYTRNPMSFDQMIAFAERVKERGSQPDASAPKRVELLDVLDQTAAAKVYAWWGTDYLLMAKYEGEWKIVQVLWQSPPGGG